MIAYVILDDRDYYGPHFDSLVFSKEELIEVVGEDYEGDYPWQIIACHIPLEIDMEGCNPLTHDQLTQAELDRIMLNPHVGERFWVKNELHEIRRINDKGQVILHPLWD